jgi:hypothetical protein
LRGPAARDADIFEVLSGLAPLHPGNDAFPGEVFLHLGAIAFDIRVIIFLWLFEN